MFEFPAPLEITTQHNSSQWDVDSHTLKTFRPNEKEAACKVRCKRSEVILNKPWEENSRRNEQQV